MMKSLFMSAFLIINFIYVSITIKNGCPIETTQDYNYGIHKLEGFETFSDINFTQCSIPFNFTILYIQPTKALILNNSLNFTGITIHPPNQIFFVVLNNIKGIDIRSKPLYKTTFGLDLSKYNLVWSLEKTKFEFYKNQELINKNICDFSLSYDSNNNTYKVYSELFFTGLQCLVLESSVEFLKETCPFIFMNSAIRILNIKFVYSTFIGRNLLSFMDIQEKGIEKITSNVLQLIIKVYHVKLDSSILNKYVFGRISFLDINGQISSIQEDLFKSFKNLKVLRIRTQNTKSILTHKNKWIQSLNYDVNVDLNNERDIQQNLDRILYLIIFQTYSNLTFYDYPEEDFCFFSGFPHHKLVMPDLKPDQKSSCSCTEIFLVQYSYNLEKGFKFYTDQLLEDYYYLNQYYLNEIRESSYSSCMNSSFLLTVFKCDFSNRLKKCEPNSTNIKSEIVDIYWYMSDWSELSNHSYHLFAIYINPTFSFICIIINILMICVFSNKFINNEMKIAYKYLAVHSYSNIFYISLLLLKYFMTCKDEDLFCSKFSYTEFANYFEKIFVNVIKKVFQSFSNINYFWFVLFRYIKITNPKIEYLIRLNKFSFKTIILATISFTILINSYAYFEHDPVDNEYIGFKIKVKDPKDHFKTNLSQIEYYLFNVFQYLKIIFSDLLFIVLILIIDIRLGFFIKKSIVNSNQVNVSKRAIKKKKTSKKRITAMVILNGFNLFVLRLPSALMDFYGLVFSYYKKGDSYQFEPNMASYIVCRTFNFCISLHEVFYSFYFISFLFQFFIFYKLDKNFFESLVNIKSRYLKRINNIFRYLTSKIYRINTNN